MSQRVFAVSDLHADYGGNMAWLQALSDTEYRHDVLIVAGDVSDNLDTLQRALARARAKFAQVVFIPGNHELWIRRGEAPDSIAKWHAIARLCEAIDIHTQPLRTGGTTGVWIVPLLSWYVRPEESCDSLFLPKQGESLAMTHWSDDYFTRWPRLAAGQTVAEYFLRLNAPHVQRQYDAPVISCSHFLPRTDLMFSTPQERAASGITLVDSTPYFNFSRVAGSKGIEAQIRQLGSVVHVYGHQHRNRRRYIDGIWYMAHCLGYRRERDRGYIRGLENGPALVWDPQRPVSAFADGREKETR